MPRLSATPLSDEQLTQLLKRALADKERGLGQLNVTAQDDALEMISSYANGDARYAYNALETAAKLVPGGVSPGRSCKMPCSKGCCSTTNKAKSTST